MVRFKNRYLLVTFIFPDSISNPFDPSTDPLTPPPRLQEGGLISLLRESLNVNFGDVGAGEVGGAFSIKYLSPHTQMLILRVAREHLRTLWAALTLLRRVGGHEVLTRVLHVSGTIRKIQHVAIAHDRAAILGSAKQGKSTKTRGPPGEPVSGSGDAMDAEDQEESETEKSLRQSEDAIGAIEA